MERICGTLDEGNQGEDDEIINGFKEVKGKTAAKAELPKEKGKGSGEETKVANR